MVVFLLFVVSSEKGNKQFCETVFLPSLLRKVAHMHMHIYVYARVRMHLHGPQNFVRTNQFEHVRTCKTRVRFLFKSSHVRTFGANLTTPARVSCGVPRGPFLANTAPFFPKKVDFFEPNGL